MNCIICNAGVVESDKITTVTLNRDEAIIIIKNVPASVCDGCGEAYFGTEITDKVMKFAENLHRTGNNSVQSVVWAE